MKEKDCWDKFAVSGKVEDYLEYRSSVGHAAHNKADGTQTPSGFTSKPDVCSSSSGGTVCSGKTGF